MENTKKLQIVMFPWLAFGHMIPFLELSKYLAKKGHHISFVSAPQNLLRLQPKIPQNLASLITLVPLPLPRHEDLPSDAEATTDVGFAKGADILKTAYDGLQEPLIKFLESASHKFDYIIYDYACYWVPQVADTFGIRKVFFSVFFSRTLAFIGPANNMDAYSLGPWNNVEAMTRPMPWIPFPNNIFFTPYQAKNFAVITELNTSDASDMFRLKSCIEGCDAIAIRSCMELEAEYIQLLENLNNKVVIPVGLMPPSMGQCLDDETWQSINDRLEKQQKGSLVYVAFGSEFEPTQEELTELALGLELSKLPFFWVLRPSAGNPSIKLPEGFEERTKDRGVVWTSWAPQCEILAHDSVGGFLTHCGWSSVIEALQFAKPLIMLPLAIDHGLYAILMVELKAGIAIPRNEEDGSFSRSSVAKTLKLMFQDDAGKLCKDEAKKLSVTFADQSLQGRYIDKFDEYLQS